MMSRRSKAPDGGGDERADSVVLVESPANARTSVPVVS
jgi:hypothetical protein